MSGWSLGADILYMNNLQTGSVLDYTLTYLHAILSRARDKWDLPPKSGLVEITLSKEYHRIYSGLQYVSLWILVNASSNYQFCACFVWKAWNPVEDFRSDNITPWNSLNSKLHPYSLALYPYSWHKKLHGGLGDKAVVHYSPCKFQLIDKLESWEIGFQRGR